MPLLGLIRTKGRDVDQGGDAWVHTGVRDDGAPVGVADKNDRTADAAECADGRVDITFQRVQAVLRSHHLVTLRLKRRDQLLETGTIGPDAVGEDNARFVLLVHFSPRVRWPIRYSNVLEKISLCFFVEQCFFYNVT